MENDDFSAFFQQYEQLKVVVLESNRRSLTDPPDELFRDHVNVFIKSYLVSSCSILEALLLEVATVYLDEMKSHVARANIPNNMIRWAIVGDKPDSLGFSSFTIDKVRKDISDDLSANVGKTIRVFKWLGVDLTADANFNDLKDFVASIVTKRNDIVHHNYDASDISLIDVANTIDQFLIYSGIVIGIVSNCPFRAPR